MEPEGVKEEAENFETPSTHPPTIQEEGELTWLEARMDGTEEALVRAELGQLEVGDLGGLWALFSDVADGSAMRVLHGLASSFRPKSM